ncbi:MAG: phosphoglucosamine mutase [Candidatus Cloacimonetes bacterium]|nr:phosphoglucosamine mutase [Candidatus Cloacimonadota bacterium]
MDKLMISVSGIRGIFGTALTPEIACRYAAHFGKFCGGGPIVVGRDSRTTGAIMFHAVTSGLLSVGCDVIDVGIAATPTILLKVAQTEARGGLAITASHNPVEWNALKLISSEGHFLFPEQAKKFIAGLDAAVNYNSWNKIGKMWSDHDAAIRHINKILAIPYLDVGAIRRKKFKVIIDSVNGAGSTVSPHLLRELGCDVIELNSEPNGIFSHPPEPLAENLQQLEKAVLEHSADIGFATDPDVDRLAIVSDKGEALGEESSLLLAEKFVLSHKKGDVVINLSSSMASDIISAQFGVRVHRTSIGEINVARKMMEINSPIGGEGNGGIICPEVQYSRDAPAGMALILGYLTETGRTVSELAALIPKFYMVKDRIAIQDIDPELFMNKAATLYEHYQIDKTDGVKYTAPDHWIHIRSSGTEPIIRIYVESSSRTKSEKICHETISRLKRIRQDV